VSARPEDTIAAIATPPGRGGIGVLRICGPQACAVAERIAGALPAARRFVLREFRDSDGATIDRGLVLRFAAPHSFTGEDMVELHAHGGPVVLECLLQAACAAGARCARPGEFSERAFLNGRLDLTQAEAIADLIEAASRGAVRAAARALEGEFSKRVNELVEGLIAVRVDLEAALDFADEDVPWIDADRLALRLAELRARLSQLQAQAAQGRRLREGLVVAIAGRPNVGKSTLLNRLCGAEAAIVSPVAGTTRDVLREHVLIDGLPLTLIDTAGLRETAEPVEQEGVRRARAALEKAELVLFVLDDTAGMTAEDRALLASLPAQVPVVQVYNKCDLSDRPPTRWEQPEGHQALRLSAACGAGLEELHATLKRHAGFSHALEGVFSARQRHLEALRRAAEALARAQSNAGQAHAELVAEDLRLAQQALDEITGRFTTEDLLGRIFAGFCIGK
jgi:tRNA modification GTPase